VPIGNVHLFIVLRTRPETSPLKQLYASQEEGRKLKRLSLRNPDVDEKNQHNGWSMFEFTLVK